MGYKWRKTSGKCDCRPEEFKRDLFPPNTSLCSPKCIYHIFCQMEINKVSLGDRIKKLRLSFQKPYYVFSIMENGDVFLVFENEEGERVSFREKTLIGAVKKAEDYLKASKIRAGQQAKLEEQSSSSTTPETPKTSEEGDGIEIKTLIRDESGRKHPADL